MINQTWFRRSSLALGSFLSIFLVVLINNVGIFAQLEPTQSADPPANAPQTATAVNQIYWTDKDDHLIGRANADGSNLEVLVSDIPNPRGIALNIPGGKMYWADQDTDQIMRANLNGTNVEVLLPMNTNDLPNVIALDLNRNKIYWTNRAQNLFLGHDGIWRANLDGSQRELLVAEADGLDWPVGIALDLARGKMYWVELRLARIRRANLDGSGIEELVTAEDGLQRPLEIALDLVHDKMYWTDEDAHAIRRANLDGSNVETLLGNDNDDDNDDNDNDDNDNDNNDNDNDNDDNDNDDLEEPRGIALDVAAGKIYWADKEAARIQRANLDGSGLETLLSEDDGLNYPFSLALDLGGGVTCFNLTLIHTGAGGDPAASPTGSPGCSAGKYVAGEAISLAASPASGGRVANWDGTNNDSSSSTNNALTMPAGHHTVTVHYEENPPNCYRLTLTHTGMGSDPIASPPGSPGCGDGLYRSDTTISLTAAPDANWVVDGWSGTANDASTAIDNSLIMPEAEHTVTVHYRQTVQCYPLTQAHSGSGSDPAAVPGNSPGCAAGQYVAGATIALTADPTDGWRVKNWSGTLNDGAMSITNQAIMPATTHTVIVHYEQIPCYRLTRTHEGQGIDPIATPARSGFCGTSEYVAGETITLQASPAAGWSVGGWNGTNNDSSLATTNSLTMPSGNHTVSVRYNQRAADCHQLTLNYTGQGSNPSVVPARSAACTTGFYVRGESLSLNASPAIGWKVNSWSGTANDASQEATNSLVMPDSSHAVTVNYLKSNATFMPVTTYGLPPDCFLGPLEQEPNNKGDNPNGPLCSWVSSVQGFPNDNYDFFTFETTTDGLISVKVHNHAGSGVQVRLYYQEYIAGTSVASGFSLPDYALRWEGSPGLYYILIFTDTPVPGTNQPYTLEVVRP